MPGQAANAIATEEVGRIIDKRLGNPLLIFKKGENRNDAQTMDVSRSNQ